MPTKDRWKEENVRQAVKASVNYSECVRKLGLSDKAPGNRQTLKKYIDKYDLDISHFTFKPRYEERDLPDPKNKIPLDEILVENSTYNNSHMKRRILDHDLLENECTECGLPPEWNGKELTLQLDHINGVNNDNRLKNLRLLCPNCHSQTQTWGNKSNDKQLSNTCQDCEDEIYRTSTRCRSCAATHSGQTKIDWPSDDRLKELVWEMPVSSLGQQLGVSGRAIKKRCRKYDIETPGRGYWQKKKAGKLDESSKK